MRPLLLAGLFLLASCRRGDARPMGWAVLDGSAPAIDLRVFELSAPATQPVSPADSQSVARLVIHCDPTGIIAGVRIPALYAPESVTSAILGLGDRAPLAGDWIALRVDSGRVLLAPADSAHRLWRDIRNVTRVRFTFTPIGRAERTLTFELQPMPDTLARAARVCGLDPVTMQPQ